MSQTRKVVVMDSNGKIWTEEEQSPTLRPGQLLVEVRASMVSPGSGLGGVKGRRANPGPNPTKRPFGYSNAGVVIDKSGDCDEFEIGDRVAGMGGGYAQHATHACIPHNLCAKIPDNVSDAEAASNHLAATALHAVQRGRIVIGENVVVAGLGLVGQLACQIAQIAGAYVMGLDRLPLRVKIAQEAGVNQAVNISEADALPIAAEFTNGYGMDCGIIAFGGDGTEAFRQIRSMLKTTPDTHKMGRIVIVGGANITHIFAAGLGNVDVISAARTGPGYHDEAYEHGSDYPPVFVPWPTQRNLELVLRFMSEGKLKVKPLITDVVPIDQAAEGCEKLIQTPDEALGVVFTMS
ncbi:MAG: zinc-binding alcohol dehydrogenase [Candidatus Poribacteria bacterium]|nr:zinc-binding alcohol dehydrogenase [Candidatus Poribacteria bacterium]